MYKTIEAMYDNGKILPLYEKIPNGKSKVLITILDESRKLEHGLTLSRLKEFAGKMEGLNRDGLEYQKEIRDEW